MRSIAVVKNGGLARRHGPERGGIFGKNLGRAVPERHHPARDRPLAAPHLNRQALFGGIERNRPANPLRPKTLALELAPLPHNHRRRLGLEANHVARLAAPQPQPPPLAHREVADAGMAAEAVPLAVHNLAGPVDVRRLGLERR